MRIITAAWYEFLKNIRDIKMMIIIIVFSTVTTMILGSTVGSFFNQDSSRTMKIGYINQDKGTVGDAFDKFIMSGEISKRLGIVKYTDRAECQRAIDKGRVDSAVYLPENVSRDILSGKKGSIMIFGKKNVEFVQSIVSGFSSTYNTMNAVIAVNGKLAPYSGESSLKRISYNEKSAMPSMTDYYAVLELLMMLIIGAIFGIYITSRNQDSDIHIRLHSLPVSRQSLIAGQIIGSTIYLFLMGVTVMVITGTLFGVNWNGNMAVILGTLLAFSSIIIGIGVLIGIFVRNFSTGLMIVLTLVMIFGVTSGSVSPVTTNDLAGLLSPNYHAKIIIFGTIYGYSKDVMLKSAMYLMGFITVIYGAAAIFIGRAKYDNI